MASASTPVHAIDLSRRPGVRLHRHNRHAPTPVSVAGFSSASTPASRPSLRSPDLPCGSEVTRSMKARKTKVVRIVSHNKQVSYQTELGKIAQTKAAANPKRSFHKREATRYKRRHMAGAVAQWMNRMTKAEARLWMPKTLKTSACSEG